MMIKKVHSSLLLIKHMIETMKEVLADPRVLNSCAGYKCIAGSVHLNCFYCRHENISKL